MKKIFVVVIVSFTFNLFAITDGIRYCQHIDLGGYCTDITSTRFDLSQYTWTGGTPQNDNVSSILVMSGWEAWVCKDANHYGDCMFLSAGTYNMTNYAGWNDQISSITVQPTTFYEAWSYYGKREFGESGTAPYGFAYAYACLNFVGCKRLFLKYPDSISSLSNYIVKKNQIRSIELDGNVKATLHRDGYSSKILFSSHKNFSISNSITQQYGYLNLTAFDQTVDGIMISMAPSIGFFQSELRQDFSGYPYILDFYNAYNFDNTTIDDARHEAYEVNFSLGVADPNYGSQTSMAQKVSYYQNDQYTQRYGDNYDLLAIAAHGTLDIMDTDPTVRNHWVAINSDLYPEDSNPYWYYKKYGGILKGWYEELPNYVEGAYSDWSKYIGTKSTEWVLDSSCGSFGNHIDQHHGNISWSEILDIYDGPSTENGILDNLHGYGGTRGDWFFFVDDGESLGEEFYLNLSQYSVSSAWVASFAHLWTYVSGVLMNRDARYLTKETCDCSSIFCVAAYMNNDHFHLYGTTQPDKGSRDNYPYTCMRRNSSWYLYDGTPYDPYLKMSSSVPSEVDGGVDETIYMSKSFTENDFLNMFYIKNYDSSQKINLDENEYYYFNKNNGHFGWGKKEVESVIPEDETGIIYEFALKESAGLLEKWYDYKMQLESASFETLTGIKDGEPLNEVAIGLHLIYKPAINGKFVDNKKIKMYFTRSGLSKVFSNAPKEIFVSEENVRTKDHETILSEIASQEKMDNMENYEYTGIYYMDETGTIIPAVKYVSDRNILAEKVLIITSD